MLLDSCLIKYAKNEISSKNPIGAYWQQRQQVQAYTPLHSHTHTTTHSLSHQYTLRHTRL